jgi:predicted nucleic acid-binding protein
LKRDHRVAMKAKVYIETTIPSYLVARRSRDPIVAAHQQLTRNWWEFRRSAFHLYVSESVLEEAAAGDATLARERVTLLANIPVLAMTSTIIEVAEGLVAAGTIPRKAAVDALHIAVATAYGCEFLLTWNCRHIANAGIRRAAASIVSRRGFELPVICTPEELMGESE